MLKSVFVRRIGARLSSDAVVPPPATASEWGWGSPEFCGLIGEEGVFADSLSLNYVREIVVWVLCAFSLCFCFYTCSGSHARASLDPHHVLLAFRPLDVGFARSGSIQWPLRHLDDPDPVLVLGLGLRLLVISSSFIFWLFLHCVLIFTPLPCLKF
jgi:hypothetical protein